MKFFTPQKLTVMNSEKINKSEQYNIVSSKENTTKDQERKRKYPDGPNTKQGYPDEKKPNKDDLHQDHMIEKKPAEKNKKKQSWYDPRETFKGWTLIM
jgi:hypothetical protein